MAEAIVNFAVERLGELLISEAKLLSGVSDQINEVLDELKRIQCFLREADKKQNQDARVRQWVEEMRELAFKIEDVTETFAMQVPSKKQRSGFKQMLRRFACIFCEGVSRHNIATDINAIKAEISNLTERLKTYGITKGLDEGETSSSLVDLKSRRTYPHDIEKDFVGMEKDIEKLISYLKMKGPGCEVVSICGMGGQGKTTLAKKLYNHPEVKAHFQAFAWVCITQQFEREKVLKAVLKELLPHMKKEELAEMDDAELVQKLYKVQQEKNCLIVMDDIWKENHWSSLKPAFPVGETTSGSKVLLTSRDAKVANIGNIVHNISVLKEEEGLQLLSKKAGIINLPEKREMETIGRNMVKKCKGLPLAISSLGGILKGKSLKDWEKINKDIPHYLAKGAGVSDDDKYNTVMWVLGLSYDSLPPHLRHCFLWFAHYPEDEEIETEELYMFWLAEGLISVEHKAEGEMMLDVAERYLDELANRSLVQVDKCEVGESWSTYRTCRVHDLIRELCLGKAKEEKVIHVIHLTHTPHEDASTANIVRRLCICSYELGDESKLKPYDQNVISHIRSLLVWKIGYYSPAQWPDEIISLEKFKLLRVLTVRGYFMSENNIRCISKLVYLKYLCLRVGNDVELPSSIGDLRNLETLDLRLLEYGSMAIPNVLWKLEQLKHLYLPEFIEGDDGRDEKLRLKGLNKLEVIHQFNSWYCDAHDLLELPKLKVFSGTIQVEDNPTPENIFDYINSSELRHSTLTIEGDGGLSCFIILLLECCFIDHLTIYTRICRFPKEYDHTRFSVRLTKLCLIDYCRIEEDPMILLEKLPNLRRLGLWRDAYLGAEMVCSAMGFPQLQQLQLIGLPNLRKWRVDEGAMPNLSSSWIENCRELEMLPEGLTYLTALRDLRIANMPITFTNKIKEEDGVDFYKISHISRVYIR